MDAKDLIADDGCKGQAVENLGKALPNICISVLLAAFVVKAICLRDRQCLVIAPKQCNPIPVPHF